MGFGPCFKPTTMNDQITLDHPSCHPVKGWFRATGEWEASDDVLIHLIATGRGNGIGIDWDYQVQHVELFEGDRQIATSTHLPVYLRNEVMGVDWNDGEPTDKSSMSILWMLGVAYCWAMKSAEDWANKNAEGIAE
jgi:hypothetical protein